MHVSWLVTAFLVPFSWSFLIVWASNRWVLDCPAETAGWRALPGAALGTVVGLAMVFWMTQRPGGLVEGWPAALLVIVPSVTAVATSTIRRAVSWKRTPAAVTLVAILGSLPLVLALGSSLNSALRIARLGGCESNLKNIGLALHEYVSDNGAGPPTASWRDTIFERCGRCPFVLVCPSDRRSGVKNSYQYFGWPTQAEKPVPVVVCTHHRWPSRLVLYSDLSVRMESASSSDTTPPPRLGKERRVLTG